MISVDDFDWKVNHAKLLISWYPKKICVCYISFFGVWKGAVLRYPPLTAPWVMMIMMMNVTLLLLELHYTIPNRRQNRSCCIKCLLFDTLHMYFNQQSGHIVDECLLDKQQVATCCCDKKIFRNSLEGKMQNCLKLSVLCQSILQLHITYLLYASQ